MLVDLWPSVYSRTDNTYYLGSSCYEPTLSGTLSFRSAQIHKDLVRQDVVKEVTPLPVLIHPRPSQSVVRVLTIYTPPVASQTRLHCSNDLSVSLPILELIPLIPSGSAENRVDLAFFAAGCT